jgi:hypothetical protein
MACNLVYALTGITGDCSSLSGGSFSISISGTAPDYTIQWVSPYTTIIPLGAGVTNYTATGLTAGTYSFNVVDSCIDPGQTSLFVSLYVSSGTCVSVNNVSNTLCNLDNGSINASTQFNYGQTRFSLYHNSLGFIRSTQNIPTGNVTFDNLPAGPYYIVADDGGGCTGRTSTVIVQDSSQLDYGIYVVNDAGCAVNSGKLYVTGITGTPPYTYLWSNNESTSSITGLTSGSYEVTVADSSGCVVVKSAIVNKVLPVGQAGVYVTQPGCFGSNGSATIVLSGGTPPFYYSGSNGVIIVDFANFVEFTNLPGGTFSYYVQDAGLCTYNGSVSLQTPSSFNLVNVTTTNTSCGNNSGSLTAAISNGLEPYVYKLSGVNAVTTTLPSYTFSNLSSGTYTLTITDGSNCSYTNQYTIEDNVKFNYTFSSTGTTCAKDDGIISVTITDGIGPYLFEVGERSQIISSNEATFDGFADGTYNISVTDTGNNCKISNRVIIEDSVNVNFLVQSTNPLNSNNGTITLFITSGEPPFTIDWSDNVGGQTGMSIGNLSAGTYNVTVTDDNGCILQRTIELIGDVCVVSYEVYSVCQDEFQSNGQLIEKTPLLMLNEGYADLVSDESGCVLNEAVFEAIVNVSGITTSSIFYTTTTLTQAPSEGLFATTVRNLLLGYDGIGDVVINNTTNKITITSDCESEVSLLDVDVVVNLKISYDISCSCSKSCNPYGYLSTIDFMDDEYNVPTHQEITSFLNSNCGCDYTSSQNVLSSYNSSNYPEGAARGKLDYFNRQYNQYSLNKFSGFCEGDVGFSVPDVSLISNISFPDNFATKGRPIKIKTNVFIKASQTEGWYTTSVGSILSAYTDDIRYIRAVSTIGERPLTGQPGDLILVGNLNSAIGYAWNPSTNVWSDTFYNTISTNIISEIINRRNAFAKAKYELARALRPFTWASNYILLHGIKRFPLNNVKPMTGNEIIEKNGDNLPCGYSQNLNDCGSLDPFCGPNKQDDNDLC